MPRDVPCFFTVPSDRVRLALRRFTFSNDKLCKARGDWGCDAQTAIGDAPERPGKPFANGRGHYGGIWRVSEFQGDPRWPTACAACGEPFDDDAEWQVFVDHIYLRADGQPGEFTLREAPVGMMWDAAWMPDQFFDGEGGLGWSMLGPDGVCLAIQLPYGHTWMPESRASNCTMKDDNRHHCWVRHGDARKNEVHVDKSGLTCQAGAGSIQTGRWHGFVHNSHVIGVPDDSA